MAQISYLIPIVGQPDSTEEPKISTALTVILSAINSGLDKTNLSTTSGVATWWQNIKRNISYGGVTFTWPGSAAASNTATVPHGLGTNPGFIVLQPGIGSPQTWGLVPNLVATTDATNFQAQLVVVDGPNPATNASYFCYWLAIG